MNEFLEFFNAYRAPTQHIVSLLLAAAVWRWGGRPERWLTGIFIVTMVLPVYVIRALNVAPGIEVGQYSTYVTMLDLVAAVLFVSVALNANRNYPLWVAGFQLVAVGGHLANILVGGIAPFAVAILVIGPAYCQLVLLIGGFVRHVLRQRRFGTYRDWRIPPQGARGFQL